MQDLHMDRHEFEHKQAQKTFPETGQNYTYCTQDVTVKENIFEKITGTVHIFTPQQPGQINTQLTTLFYLPNTEGRTAPPAEISPFSNEAAAYKDKKSGCFAASLSTRNNIRVIAIDEPSTLSRSLYDLYYDFLNILKFFIEQAGRTTHHINPEKIMVAFHGSNTIKGQIFLAQRISGLLSIPINHLIFLNPEPLEENLPIMLKNIEPVFKKKLAIIYHEILKKFGRINGQKIHLLIKYPHTEKHTLAPFLSALQEANLSLRDRPYEATHLKRNYLKIYADSELNNDIKKLLSSLSKEKKAPMETQLDTLDQIKAANQYVIAFLGDIIQTDPMKPLRILSKTIFGNNRRETINGLYEMISPIIDEYQTTKRFKTHNKFISYLHNLFKRQFNIKIPEDTLKQIWDTQYDMRMIQAAIPMLNALNDMQRLENKTVYLVSETNPRSIEMIQKHTQSLMDKKKKINPVLLLNLQLKTSYQQSQTAQEIIFTLMRNILHANMIVTLREHMTLKSKTITFYYKPISGNSAQDHWYQLKSPNAPTQKRQSIFYAINPYVTFKPISQPATAERKTMIRSLL